MKRWKQLIQIGCERILTSGQNQSAPDAVDMIAELNKVADDRIIIMPGSGVRKENIKMLAEKTGCTLNFILRFVAKKQSNMDFIHPGFAGSEESYMNNDIDADEVRAFRRVLD